MFTTQNLYIAFGLLMLFVAYRNWRDPAQPKRWTTAAFWLIYGLIYLIGDHVDPRLVGVGMIVMALIAGFNGMGLGRFSALSEQDRAQSAQRLGHKLFLPLLIFPLIVLVGPWLLKNVMVAGLPVLDLKSPTIGGVGMGCVIAAIAAMVITRGTPQRALEEARRLVDITGWPFVLPAMLATLGALFTTAGVGKAVAGIVVACVPVSSALAVVAAYAIGMALFTMIMGNAFAAFPILAAGVGLPFLVNMHHGNPAVMAAIGMFSGYCGTLMTPMAANFNIVPAALLEIPDKYAVIRAQWKTALPLLAANIVLLYVLAFR